MVSLKTFDSPVEKNALTSPQWGSTSITWCLELKVEYQSMKQKMDKNQNKIEGDYANWRESSSGDRSSGWPRGGGGECSGRHWGGRRWVDESKGYQDAKNPGKLIIGNQRYLSVSAVSLVKTFPYWYTCEIIKLGRKSVENIYFKFVSNTPLCNFKCLLRWLAWEDA